MKIVAFLQESWLPEGTIKEVVDRYTTNRAFRSRMFRNTVPGRRLVQAFGSQEVEKIWWDQVIPTPSYNAAGITASNAAHIDRVINEQNPDLILCFGNQAANAIKRSAGSIRRKVMVCHHPTSRCKNQSDLDKFALDVRIWILEQEL